MGSCSDRALEKENYVCFRCFQNLLFKGSKNYDISPNELSLPSAFLQDMGKADVPRAGRSGDKCVWGGKASGRGSDERGFEAGSLRGQALVQSSLGMSAQHSQK